MITNYCTFSFKLNQKVKDHRLELVIQCQKQVLGKMYNKKKILPRRIFLFSYLNDVGLQIFIYSFLQCPISKSLFLTYWSRKKEKIMINCPKSKVTPLILSELHWADESRKQLLKNVLLAGSNCVRLTTPFNRLPLLQKSVTDWERISSYR